MLRRTPTRGLVTSLFTDIVGSTAISVELGDQRWHSLQGRHHAIVRRELKRFHGHEVDTAGDGFFATFGIPADGVRCAAAIAEAMPGIGLQTRAGLHTGETELTGEKVAGIAVTTAARVSALAGPGEVLVTRTVAELVAGSGFGFSDRGEHELKGVPGTWHLLALSGIEGEPFVPSLDPDEAVERRESAAAVGLAHPRRRMIVLVGAVTVIALIAATLPFILHRAKDGPALVSNGIQLLDARSGQRVGTVPLVGAPGGIASGGGSAWVSDAQNGTIVKIDPSTRAVVDTIPVGNGPSGIAFGDRAVWVALSGDGELARIDPSTDTVVDRVSVGNAPTGVGVFPGSVWVTNYLDYTVMRVDTASNTVVDTFPVGSEPVAVAANADGAWVANYGAGTVTQVPLSGQGSRSIGVGNGPSGIAITPTAVWVTNSFDNSLWQIGIDTGSVVRATPNMGDGPAGVTVDSATVWVADRFGGAIARVSTTNGQPTAPPIQVGAQPVAMSLVGGELWVAASAPPSAHRGGTLTFASQAAPDSLDPATAYFSWEWQILSLTNDGLMGFARVGGPQGGAIVPDLASSVLPSVDAKTYSFHLRPGIRYSNGTSVRPEDFVRGIERALLVLAPKSPVVPYYSEIVGASRCTSIASCSGLAKHGIVTTEATATTDATITFHLTRSDREFLYKLALPFADAVPADTPMKVIDAAPYLPATGPYMIRSYTPGVTNAKGVIVKEAAIELVRNPYFAQWSQAAQPDGYPDQIDGSYGLSPSKQVSMIKQGGLDVMADDSPPPHQLSQLNVAYASQLYDTVLPQTLGFAMNTRLAPFKDVRVRRALNYAIDRDRLVTLFGGPQLAQVSCQILPPDFPGHRPYCPYTKDPRASGRWSGPDLGKAQKLVEASDTRSIPVTVWVPGSGFLPFQSAGGYIVSVLKGLGYRHVDLHVVHGVTAKESLDKYFGQVSNPHVSASVQISAFGWIPDYFSPSGFVAPLFGCDFIPTGTNTSHFCETPIETAMQKALTEQASDPAVAGAAWAGVDRSIVNQAPWVMMPTPKQIYFVSSGTGNVQVSPQWGILLSQLWVNH